MRTMVLSAEVEAGNNVGVVSTPQGGTPAHVLFLIDELCRKGGAELALLNTVRWLPKRFRCSVITFRVDPNLPMLAEFPCPVKVLPLRRTYDWNALRMALKLSKFIRREQVDVVHTFFASSDLWGGAIAKLSRGPALVSSRRDMGFLRKTKHNVAYRLLGPMFDQLLTVSDQVGRFCIEQDRLNSTKVKTIYNAVECRTEAMASASLDVCRAFRTSGYSHVIASVGNVRRVKGFDVLIRAAALVCRELPKALFLIAGASDPAESDCIAKLQKLSESLGIADNVRVIGPVDDVFSLLKGCDAFWLLSRSEGFSSALLEAMACGLPCVATQVGGNPEAIKEGENGFLVASEDFEGAAARMLDVLMDHALAQRMGACSKAAVEERFTSDVVTAQLVEVYDSLLSMRRLSRR